MLSIARTLPPPHFPFIYRLFTIPPPLPIHLPRQFFLLYDRGNKGFSYFEINFEKTSRPLLFFPFSRMDRSDSLKLEGLLFSFFYLFREETLSIELFAIIYPAILFRNVQHFYACMIIKLVVYSFEQATITGRRGERERGKKRIK